MPRLAQAAATNASSKANGANERVTRRGGKGATCPIFPEAARGIGSIVGGTLAANKSDFEIGRPPDPERSCPPYPERYWAKIESMWNGARWSPGGPTPGPNAYGEAGFTTR